MESKISRTLLLMLGAGLLLCLVVMPLAADSEDPPARVARLSYSQGNVSLQPSGEDQWSKASTNYTVTTGDRLYTDEGSRAEFETGDYTMRMSQTTDLAFTNLQDHLMQVGLGQGSLEVSVYRLNSGDTVEIDTPNGALTVLGAGRYRVDTNPTDGSSLVQVTRGSLDISGGSGATQTLQTGQAARLTGTTSVDVATCSVPAGDDFDNWCAGRDKLIQAAAADQYVSPSVPGVEELDSYGHWVAEASYGAVWFPTGVAVGWVPYRVGHWAWVEPWGWTWVSHEPWGFAPYHYGRWAVFGGAWGWVPGPVVAAPVYAPALVAFVGGDGFSVGLGLGLQAWFPLGPREVYVPWYHHGDAYLRQVNITNARNIDVTHIQDIDVTKIHYVNQRVATTAVPTSIFRNGQAISGKIVQVNSAQMGRAQILEHPMVAPSETAAFRGAPPVRVARPTTLPPGFHGSVRPPATSPVTGPSKTLPPAHTPNGNVTGRTPGARRPAHAGPPSARPHFVTKLAPPPADVPFARRSATLEAQPGRPLEPQQKDNLRHGRPAGPPRDTSRQRGGSPQGKR